MHSAPWAGADGAGGPLGVGDEERWASRTQLVTISCCAWARLICPSHTFWRSSFSTVSLGFGEAPGSGQRLRGSLRRAAELERHEVVVLVVAERAGVAVGGHARGLLLLGDALRRAHRGCPALDADRLVDRGLGDGGVERAGRAGRVRAGVEAGADRVAGARGGLRLHDVVARRRVREGTRARIGRRRWVTTMRAAAMVRRSFRRPCPGGGAHCRRRRGGLRRGRACRGGVCCASRCGECRGQQRRRQRAAATVAHRLRARRRSWTFGRAHRRVPDARSQLCARSHGGGRDVERPRLPGGEIGATHGLILRRARLRTLRSPRRPGAAADAERAASRRS